MKRKLIAIFMTIAMLTTMVPAAFAADETSDSFAEVTTQALTQVDGVYQIGTAAEFMEFVALVNNGDYDANAVLTANIDMSGQTDYVPMGTYSNPYSGEFNGQDYTISNLSITGNDSHMWAGIFGVVSGTVSHLKLDNVDVNNSSQSSGGDSAQAASGSIAGAIRNGGTVEYITALSTCSVEGFYRTGGIVGSCRDRNASVSHCVNYAAVTGHANYTGGIVGAAHNFLSITSNFGTFVSDCTNHGSVTGTTEVGGIVGYTDRASVTNCLNKGTISGSGNYGTGGIVGCDIYNPQSIFIPAMGSTISDSTNEGAATAPRAGGILGSYVIAPGDSQPTIGNKYSTITDCINTGAISSANNAGKCGAIYGAPISYAHGDAESYVNHMIVRLQNCKVAGSVEGTTITAENYMDYIAASNITDETGNEYYNGSN